MDLSPQEQRELTITYAALFGGEFERNGHWWVCGGYEAGDQYLAAVRFLEAKGHYLHSNGTLMTYRRRHL